MAMRMEQLVIASFLIVAAATGCRTWGDAERKAAEGGIEGTVLKGPLCPGPARLDRPCPDRPLEAWFLVLDQNGTQVVRFRSDPAGRFMVMLPAGRYVVIPAPGTLMIAPEARQEVSVEAGRVVSVTWHFDTGMR